MKLNREQAISMEEFLDTCRREVSVPIGRMKVGSVMAEIPETSFRRFVAGSRELLESDLYAASDTDPERLRWLDRNEDVPEGERRAITYRDLLSLPELLEAYLTKLRLGREGRPERPTPHAMTLHCSVCDARWLLDGNYGLVRIFIAGVWVPIAVTEMTGPGLGMRGCSCER